MYFIAGVDIGGTAIKVGIFKSSDLELLSTFSIETPKKDPQGLDIFEDIIKGLKTHFSELNFEFKDLIGISLAVPCPVVEGYVTLAANLPWKNINVVNEMKKRLSNENILVCAINDANAAVMGENFLLDTPAKNLVFFTLGTSIGGGIIVNSQLLEGVHGYSGEFAHMIVDYRDKKVCGCGQKGCLEHKCSTAAVLEYAKELVEIKKMPSILDFKNLTVRGIFDNVSIDKVSKKVFDRYCKYLAICAANIALIIDPEIFIIGGGISHAGDPLIKNIKKYYNKYARFNSKSIPFVLAKRRNQAGIFGTVCYLKQFLG
ncbi:MAG: ROK family protein [Acholeplasmatales bacterium]|jgi:glucokinase|nr:ROK family protein [Acholeplasmatales bacterium]